MGYSFELSSCLGHWAVGRFATTEVDCCSRPCTIGNRNCHLVASFVGQEFFHNQIVELEATLDSSDYIAGSSHNTIHRNTTNFDRSIGFHCFLLGSLRCCFDRIGSSDNHTGPDYYNCNLDRLGSKISQRGGWELFTEAAFGQQVVVKAKLAC